MANEVILKSCIQLMINLDNHIYRLELNIFQMPNFMRSILRHDTAPLSTLQRLEKTRKKTGQSLESAIHTNKGCVRVKLVSEF